MGLLGKLTKLAIHTATTPLSIAKDVVTFGGLNTDQRDPYTVQRLNKLRRDLREVSEEVDDL